MGDYYDEDDFPNITTLIKMNMLHIYGNRREIPLLQTPANVIFPKGNNCNYILGPPLSVSVNRPIVPKGFKVKSVEASVVMENNTAHIVDPTRALLALQGIIPYGSTEYADYKQYLADCIHSKPLEFSDKLLKFKNAALLYTKKLDGFEHKKTEEEASSIKTATEINKSSRSIHEFKPNECLCKLFKINFTKPIFEPVEIEKAESVDSDYDYATIRPNKNVFDALFGEEEIEEPTVSSPLQQLIKPSVSEMCNQLKRKSTATSVGASFKHRKRKK
eukprot:NODE_123_length_18841_cov_0.279693.p6 type:complete len:275 gc:universal NODE_123_length_18841_cov_0.279693:9423-8599(-)